MLSLLDRRQEEERRRLDQQRRLELQKQQEATNAANKRVHDAKQGVPGQAPMGMAQQQALGVQQKAGMGAQQQQQQQPKSYLSQFRNDKDDSQDGGGHSQSSSDLQLSQDDRLSQDAYAGVEGLDATLDDKADKRDQLALLEASLKMIPDFEHDRCVRGCLCGGGFPCILSLSCLASPGHTCPCLVPPPLPVLSPMFFVFLLASPSLCSFLHPLTSSLVVISILPALSLCRMPCREPLRVFNPRKYAQHRPAQPHTHTAHDV